MGEILPLANCEESVGHPDNEYVVVIVTSMDFEENNITFQDFVIKGVHCIPIFYDIASFRKEIAGSSFEDKGALIKRSLFYSMLTEGQDLILNPGSADPIFLKREDLV